MNLKINIPQPCNENWNAMQPTSTGRHCDACQTVVIDFTKMTDAQIINHFKTSSTKICGRFSGNQLDRNLIAPQQNNNWFHLPKLSIAASILFSLLQLPASSKNKIEIRTAQTEFQKSDSTTTKLKNEIIISGFVIDSIKNKPMDYVTVSIIHQGKNIQAVYTDLDGSFAFKLSAEKYIDSIIDIKVAYIGYSILKKNNILLNSNKMELGNIYLWKKIERVFMGIPATSRKGLIDTTYNKNIPTEVKNLNSGISSGIYSTLPNEIQIRGAGENRTRIIVDGPPIKRTFWYRFKRSFRRIFF